MRCARLWSWTFEFLVLFGFTCGSARPQRPEELRRAPQHRPGLENACCNVTSPVAERTSSKACVSSAMRSSDACSGGTSGLASDSTFEDCRKQ